MRLRRIALSALLAYGATAFKNTSPFFLLSTSRIPDADLQHVQLASSSSISSKTLLILDSCPSDTYVIVSQPHVAASDYTSKESAPHLRQWLNKTGSDIPSSWIIPEVVGEIDSEAFVRRLQTKCGSDVMKVDASTGLIPNEDVIPKIVKVDFVSPPSEYSARTAKLAEHDSFLHAVISSLGGSSHTIIFTTSPLSGHHISESSPTYEMDAGTYESVLHTDLKRDVSAHDNSGSSSSDLPLFDTYLYLNPGVFVGLSVALLLFLILYVGINAVASLQVSYFAFSKEMGPSGQRQKQQ